MVRLLATLIACVCAIAGADAARADGAITAVRFGLHGDHTRIVIETSAPVSARAYTLAEPSARLVVSFDGADWAVAGLESGAGRGAGGVGVFRFDQQALSPRLIFNLDEPYAIARQMSLDPSGGGWRTVIDIAPSPEAAFQRVSGHPQPPLSLEQILAEEVGVTPPSCEVIRVVIDPGHGGRDPGAPARFGGMHEKDVVLAAGLELRELLLATGRYEVVMTRDTDVFIELDRRVEIAREAEADLFISLHADSAGDNDGPRGATVYSMNPRAVDRARVRAERAGDWVDPSRPEEVTEILRDIVLGIKQGQSETFAALLRTESGRAAPLWRDTPMQANFAVLTDPEVPAVLFEMGFLTNREDARRLNDAGERRRLMEAARTAIDNHFSHCGGGQPARRYLADAGANGSSTR